MRNTPYPCSLLSTAVESNTVLKKKTVRPAGGWPEEAATASSVMPPKSSTKVSAVMACSRKRGTRTFGQSCKVTVNSRPGAPQNS